MKYSPGLSPQVLFGVMMGVHIEVVHMAYERVLDVEALVDYPFGDVPYEHALSIGIAVPEDAGAVGVYYVEELAYDVFRALAPPLGAALVRVSAEVAFERASPAEL